MRKERARQHRRQIMLNAAANTDEIAATVPALYPAWRVGEVVMEGDRRYYPPTGRLYKCLTGHTAQADWTPDVTPSLWVRIDGPAVEWPEWEQPQGSTDAYPLGAKVSHNGKRWTSTVEANVWEPGVSGWEEAI